MTAQFHDSLAHMLIKEAHDFSFSEASSQACFHLLACLFFSLPPTRPTSGIAHIFVRCSVPAEHTFGLGFGSPLQRTLASSILIEWRLPPTEPPIGATLGVPQTRAPVVRPHNLMRTCCAWWDDNCIRTPNEAFHSFTINCVNCVPEPNSLSGK